MQELVKKVTLKKHTNNGLAILHLDIAMEKGEIVKCTRKLKTGGSDGLVGELLKYGGSGMVCLLEQLFSVVWH